MEKILDVRNLIISFRTNNGTVKAVRDISFTMNKGETLAIVGESGSGKSVTARAVMGILAGNAITEGGEILFDGLDLTKIPEDEFHKIRGNHISMIFQDPFSSLNPIARIGRQLTEAMILKDKANRRTARTNFKKRFRLLEKYIPDPASVREAFRYYSKQANEYTMANENITMLITAIDGVLLDFFRSEPRSIVRNINTIIKKSGKCSHKQLVSQQELDLVFGELKAVCASYLASRNKTEIMEKMTGARDKLASALEKPVPDFFLDSYNMFVKNDYTEDFVAGIAKAMQNSTGKNVVGETDYTALALQEIERLKSDCAKMDYRMSKGFAKSRAISMMEEVGIPEARARYRQYPFQFSGGMRQRIVIAIALAANPDLLICDEPTTALDVTIQAQILDLINSLKEKRGLSVIFITHDLGVVANVADHVAVMYAGKIVEQGTVNDVFLDPAHPYTWALLASMPDLDTKEKLDAIPGTPPNMIFPPKGDAFAARNKYAMEIDFEEQPPFFDISPTHKAATWLLHPDAPKAEPPKIVTERIKRIRMMEQEGA